VIPWRPPGRDLAFAHRDDGVGHSGDPRSRTGGAPARVKRKPFFSGTAADDPAPPRCANTPFSNSVDRVSPSRWRWGREGGLLANALPAPWTSGGTSTRPRRQGMRTCPTTRRYLARSSSDHGRRLKSALPAPRRNDGAPGVFFLATSRSGARVSSVDLTLV